MTAQLVTKLTSKAKCIHEADSSLGISLTGVTETFLDEVLLIKGGHQPSWIHLKLGPSRFMCFSQRFIFALMPLCSALYWCFCHVVKIYGAISLPWNGLIEVSGLVDLWPNMAGREKREKEGAVNS